MGEHLTWVDASLESVHGTIKVTWKNRTKIQ
ncbi:alpha-L-rhamnosidase C-terminal domain-containing protein [Paenibacillus sp. FSL H7-0737]|nr:alpha-L-rhamnosidase C-terminal domain-containing protein [Paenibacillus sp. FSL H7-0737]